MLPFVIPTVKCTNLCIGLLLLILLSVNYDNVIKKTLFLNTNYGIKVYSIYFNMHAELFKVKPNLLNTFHQFKCT